MSEQIKSKAEKMEMIYQKLLEQALKDGVITEDEDKLLLQARERIRDYQKFVDEALEDGIVTVKEHTKLLRLQDKLIRSLENEALKDNVVTEDEKLLLDTIKKMIREI